MDSWGIFKLLSMFIRRRESPVRMLIVILGYVVASNALFKGDEVHSTVLINKDSSTYFSLMGVDDLGCSLYNAHL